jgi:hypothetical protein
MGWFSSKTTNSGSTWHARVRIEKKGWFAEYDDMVSTRESVPSRKAIENAVTEAILQHSPHLKGGRVTANIRRVR